MSEAGQNIRAEPLSKDRLRAWLRLLSAHERIERRLREELRLHDSTLPRFDVLAALDRHRDGLRMSELSAKLKVSNGNVTGIVDRLAEEGLVERVPVPGDRRAMTARLTGRGAQVFAEQAAQHEGWIDAMFAELSADEARHYAARLKALAAVLDQKGKDQ